MSAPDKLPAESISAAEQDRFDPFGRCLPHGQTQAPCHRQTRRYFLPTQPVLDYAAIFSRISRYLGTDGGLDAASFERQAKSVLAKLAADPVTRKLINGVHVPFFLPQANYADIGQMLEAQYLPALAASCGETLSASRFVNHHKAGLSDKLSPLAGSRHERLLQAMQHGPVVGYYFPCMLEYSIPAAQEQLAWLPEHCWLAGGFDSCAAFIGSPDLLLRQDGYPPLLWLAGLQGEKDGVGYHFEAYGHDLTFNRRAHHGACAEYWSSALVVLAD